MRRQLFTGLQTTALYLFFPCVPLVVGIAAGPKGAAIPTSKNRRAGAARPPQALALAFCSAFYLPFLNAV